MGLQCRGWHHTEPHALWKCPQSLARTRITNLTELTDILRLAAHHQPHAGSQHVKTKHFCIAHTANHSRGSPRTSHMLLSAPSSIAHHQLFPAQPSNSSRHHGGKSPHREPTGPAQGPTAQQQPGATHWEGAFTGEASQSKLAISPLEKSSSKGRCAMQR